MDDTAPLPPAVQKVTHNISDMSAAILHQTHVAVNHDIKLHVFSVK